jgi:hypothetical protein
VAQERVIELEQGEQAFLHTRFGLGEDPLSPYKGIITPWIKPADPRKLMSVAKAKKPSAITRRHWVSPWAWLI